MTPEKPAAGITLLKAWDTSKMYRLTCDCTDPGCDHTIDVSTMGEHVVITTYTKQRTSWTSKTRWHNIWRLLTTGYAEYEASIVLSKQVALNYATVLQCAIDEVERAKNESRT